MQVLIRPSSTLVCTYKTAAFLLMSLHDDCYDETRNIFLHCLCHLESILTNLNHTIFHHQIHKSTQPLWATKDICNCPKSSWAKNQAHNWAKYKQAYPTELSQICCLVIPSPTHIENQVSFLFYSSLHIKTAFSILICWSYICIHR